MGFLSLTERHHKCLLELSFQQLKKVRLSKACVLILCLNIRTNFWGAKCFLPNFFTLNPFTPNPFIHLIFLHPISLRKTPDPFANSIYVYPLYIRKGGGAGRGGYLPTPLTPPNHSPVFHTPYLLIYLYLYIRIFIPPNPFVFHT